MNVPSNRSGSEMMAPLRSELCLPRAAGRVSADRLIRRHLVLGRTHWSHLPPTSGSNAHRLRAVILAVVFSLICLAGALAARADAGATTAAAAVQPVELLTAAELAELVAPVALYPDDLLAIVLPASTFPLQVVLAARFLEARENEPDLKPDEEWDASIVALLNYPEVVTLLDYDLKWTWQLGEAVLVQQQDVIAAVADFRQQAATVGNLKSDDKQTVAVNDSGTIEITPAVREIIHVPYYDPQQVTVYQPRRVYHYYPRTYPVYYYPYPSGHYFSSGAFWGVTSAFSIGWRTGSLHWHHHGFHDHPYFGFSYYDPFYYRRPHVWLSYTHRDRLRRHDRRHHSDNRWRNDDRRGGYRPHRPRGNAGSDWPAGGAAPGGGHSTPPTAPTARGIERALVALPKKRSGHLPVSTGSGEPAAGAVPAAGKGAGKAAGNPGRAGRTTGRALPSSQRHAYGRGREGLPVNRRASPGVLARPATELNRVRSRTPQTPGSATSIVTRPSPPTSSQMPTLPVRPVHKRPRSLGQQPAKPATAVRAPRVAAPIRKPAGVQRAVPARDAKPVQKTNPRLQQRQKRPSLSSQSPYSTAPVARRPARVSQPGMLPSSAPAQVRRPAPRPGQSTVPGRYALAAPSQPARMRSVNRPAASPAPRNSNSGSAEVRGASVKPASAMVRPGRSGALKPARASASRSRSRPE